MEVVEIPIITIQAPPWNPNTMDEAMFSHLSYSIRRFGCQIPLVVRVIEQGIYETVGGAQRLSVIKTLGFELAPCVVVTADDSEARLLSQALNHIQGEDDLGLRAELVRKILKDIPEAEVLDLLPESSHSLHILSSLGQEDMANYLQTWEQAQEARLRHLQFQLLPSQLEVVEEALARLIPEAKLSGSESPNMRGTALYLLCKKLLDLEEASP